jgi:hypothetical protein
LKKIQVCDKNSSTEFLGITGGAIGAIGDFALSPAGIVTFSVLMTIVVLGIAITSIKRKRAVKKSEN